MSMLIQISANGADVVVKASGDYSPDVMNDLTNRALEAFTHATTEPGETENVVRSNHAGNFGIGFTRGDMRVEPDLPYPPDS